VQKLTNTPGAITKEDFENMRVAGLEDGEILKVNQVAAYFAFDNRTVSGLGVSAKGEKLGLSPDDGEDWAHS